MSKLQAFLKPIETKKTKEVVVSNRYVDEKGNPVPLTIQTISQSENNKLIRLSMHTNKNKGEIYETINRLQYQARLIVASVVDPDFTNKELCDNYGVVDPLDVPAKMFLVGEYVRLVEEIMELNDFDDTDILNDEAKNS